MEVKLSTLLGNYDRPTDQPTDPPTNIGKWYLTVDAMNIYSNNYHVEIEAAEEE